MRIVISKIWGLQHRVRRPRLIMRRKDALRLTFLKHLPVWIIVALVVWLARLWIPDDQSFKEVLFAGTAGFVAGVACIFLYPPPVAPGGIQSVVHAARV
jgi:hypothetical protein